VYIDDVLVYGKTESEYVNNLRKVFQRFREKGMTANPDKCIFGAESVEFVGHVLDAEGITFSKIKFASVVDFIKPSNLKELRSFVGPVNYFRDHIKVHSIITQPLHKMITKGDKSKAIRTPGKKPMQHIRWTEEWRPASKLSRRRSMLVQSYFSWTVPTQFIYIRTRRTMSSDDTYPKLKMTRRFRSGSCRSPLPGSNNIGRQSRKNVSLCIIALKCLPTFY
jgi:hypothetical protein